MALELSEKVVISSRLVVTVWSRKPDFLQAGIVAANPSNSNGKIVQALARFFSKKKSEKVEIEAAVLVVPPAADLKSLLK
jgi:hypothetical protein